MITTDLTGSEGVMFISDQKTKKTVKVEPNSNQEIAHIKLFGNWNLQIKFTYEISDVVKEHAKKLKDYTKHYNSVLECPQDVISIEL